MWSDEIIGAMGLHVLLDYSLKHNLCQQHITYILLYASHVLSNKVKLRDCFDIQIEIKY